MDSLSLYGNLEREIIISKICAQSIKDKTGRRKSFRVTRDEINKAVQSKKNLLKFLIFFLI